MTKAAIFNKYPVFIHGKTQSEADEFIIHCRYPRFIARRSLDNEFSDGLPSLPIKGEIGHTEKGHLVYNSKQGVCFSDFIFFDSKPADEAAFVEMLREACDRAAADGCTLYDEAEIDLS
ncbi:hypothetical protein [Neisseria dentiae]|uniref:hypothetical protein n=1 Tax=Neisseria dentiae TaxID=194197 RepID=UPI00211BB7B6|nr:hypothetical protein [Neisseria dentiae]MCQ9327694.1 hypothetical protein [Neisseria dentiae]